MRLGLFGSRRPKPDGDALARIKDWVRTGLALPDEAALAANEIVCADPACPGLEVVVLVMEPGRKTRAIKIGKGAGDITEADVHAALASAP